MSNNKVGDTEKEKGVGVGGKGGGVTSLFSADI